MGSWSKPGQKLTVTMFRVITESDEFRSGVWRESSLCVSLTKHNPEHYQPEDWFNWKRIPARIVAVCNECPVRLECLSYAIQITPTEGIWGGRSSRAIKKMAHQIKEAS